MSGTGEAVPYKTAIARKGASTVAKQVTSALPSILPFRSVLDYGCGHGADVHHYRTHGYEADGYDIHEPFGWHQRPTRLYDLITVVFVLNVLPSSNDRLLVIEQANRYLKPDGAMLVVARSVKEIEKNAAGGKWPTHNDGYWSDRARGQFQHGMTPEEIQGLAASVGLAPHPRTGALRLSPNAHVLLRRS